MSTLSILSTKYKANCGECGSPMVLKQSYRFPSPFWSCSRFPECRGSHGAHPDGKPLGVPANKETKDWRIRAHDEFDKIWKTKEFGVTRQQAYKMLASLMCKHRIHIGESNVDECKIIILNSKFIIRMIKEWINKRKTL